MIPILAALLALAGSLLAGFGLYLVILSVAAALHRRPPPIDAQTGGHRLTVLVPAHNEEQLIARCVSSLLDQTYPRDQYRVVVIADNCSDETADRAAAAGAEVMARDEPDARGKGQALRWAIDRLVAAESPWEAVVIVDADSIVDRGMLAALELELAAGHAAVQADYTVLPQAGSPRSELVAAGFLLFHRVRLSGRAALGMPASLVGNGMLFSRELLEAHPWDAFTGVEDLEYTIRLRLAGIRPRFALRAKVSGPMPVSRAGAVRQRLRWEGGRFNVVKTRLWPLVRAAAVRRDANLLDAALDLATPPLGLLCLAILGGDAIAGTFVAAHLVPLWVLVPWIVALLSIPTFVLVGLLAAGAPRSTYRALLGAPVFLAWKLITYLRLLRGFDALRWDRSDRQGQAEPSSARRFDLAGVPIDPIGMAEAISRLRAAIGGPRLFQVSTINLDFMVRAQSDLEVRRIFQRSDLNVADGAPVVWLGRLLGTRVPERVAGADLVPALMGVAAEMGARVFLLGGEGGVATEAAGVLVAQHPTLVIAGTYEPPRASIEEMNHAEALALIDEAKPDILLVALGHPKQERWIEMHREHLPVSVAIGVGCVLDLIAGRSRRAPRWMQRVGLEWTYRLFQEPKRLVGRYVTDALWLIPIVVTTLRERIVPPGLVKPA
ncbi:MAG TPA: WecB/TagA/CpsF family glycosyltransferase [Candidatus Dormibacteraeota bacterium]|nr:WecB/TagA/CpsF family glycosyltransferase [Candidatus Dormibacteraeota bacterium]